MFVLAELAAPLVADTDLLIAPLSRPPVPERPNGAAADKDVTLQVYSVIALQASKLIICGETPILCFIVGTAELW